MRARVVTVVSLWLVAVVLAGCGQQQKLTAKSQAAFKSIEGKTHSAVTPVARTDRTWMPRHESIDKRLKEGNVDMLFVGDSITQGWEGRGKEVWNTYYAKRNAANFGISGDRTQHVLWRIDHSDFNNVHPKLAVIMIGTNNAPKAANNTAQEIADGIIAVCQRLRTHLPETKILLLAIFPRDPNSTSDMRAKNAQASLLASAVADGKMIDYLDINEKFLTKDGQLTREIMPDFLHPNAAGYKIWAEAMEPEVVKLMGNRK